MAGKAVVSLATGLEDPERVLVAFLVAVGAAETGRETLMFLTKEAARLAVRGTAVGVACEGCPPLADLVVRYAAAGGRYFVCPFCFQTRQLSADALIAGAELQRVDPDVELDRRRAGDDLQLLNGRRRARSTLSRPAAARRPRPCCGACPPRTRAAGTSCRSRGAITTRSASTYGSARRTRSAITSGGLDRRASDRSMHAEQDRLVRQVLEHGRVQVRLRGLDRHLVARAVGQLGQERVAGGPLVDDRGVAEADVHDGRADHAVERPVERLQPELPGRLRARLHVRLVDLDDVGAGREQVLDLRR